MLFHFQYNIATSSLSVIVIAYDVSVMNQSDDDTTNRDGSRHVDGSGDDDYCEEIGFEEKDERSLSLSNASEYNTTLHLCMQVVIIL